MQARKTTSANTTSATLLQATEKEQPSTDIVLLETAIRLIWQSSYHRVGVNEICQQAGVTKGCFYHHFTSKAELFRAAAEHFWQGLVATLDTLFADSKPAMEQLTSVIDYILWKQAHTASDGNAVSGCPFFTAGSLAEADEVIIRQTAQQLSHRSHAYQLKLVKNLEQAALCERHPDPDQTARLLQQYIQGVLLYGRVYNDLEVVRRDLACGMARILILKPEACKQLAA